MPRTPSKILSAKEAKALDLDQQIAEAEKEYMKSLKETTKLHTAWVKLADRKTKAKKKVGKILTEEDT